MNREWFFKNGVRLYIASLIVLVALIFIVYIGMQWWLLPLIPLVFVVAGNLKLAHGTMFNEGYRKLWNQFLLVMFNGVIIGYVIYFLYLYLNA